MFNGVKYLFAWYAQHFSSSFLTPQPLGLPGMEWFFKTEVSVQELLHPYLSPDPI